MFELLPEIRKTVLAMTATTSAATTSSSTATVSTTATTAATVADDRQISVRRGRKKRRPCRRKRERIG